MTPRKRLCRVRGFVKRRRAADEELRRRVVTFLMEVNFGTSSAFQVPAPPSLESDKSSEEKSAADGKEENKEDGKEAGEGAKAAEEEAPLSNEQAVLLYALRSQQTCTDEVCPTRLREQTRPHTNTHKNAHTHTNAHTHRHAHRHGHSNFSANVALARTHFPHPNAFMHRNTKQLRVAAQL